MSTLNVSDINLSGRVDHFRGADLASAATTSISGASGNYVHISGTTTITGLGTSPQAGVTRTLYFENALTLTHGAFLFLPLGQNIVTEAGDIATFVADVITPQTIWRMISYTNAQLVNNVGGQYLNKQVLTSGTTYTPTYGTRKAKIQGWAGGGAGGTTTAVAGAAAGGGASGGYFEYWLTITAHPSTFPTYAYTIGAGGTVGGAGATGGSGGNTTFVDGVTTVTAYGGPGGQTQAGTAAIKFTAGGVGGAISTNGDVNGAGESGSAGMTSTVVTVGVAGDGGCTSLGGGGQGGRYGTAAAVAGTAAIANTGSGGGGGGTGTTVSGAGGAGAAGLIIITEYR